MLFESAPAKINFGLHIIHRRADGYHDLATVFHPIGWADRITVRPEEKISMTCTDATLSCGKDNLVIRAARLLREVAGIDQGASFHLEKVLPHGAGLGGGSSDAATVLRMLCSLWKLDDSTLALGALALKIGSDVPFFLHGRTAYAEGRGERLTPMTDYIFPFSLAVVVPPIHISTAWAFQQVNVSGTNRINLIDVVRSNDLDRWRCELVNDFEEPVFSRWPKIQEIKSSLLRSGAGFASLTGSGAGVYGVFESKDDAKEAAEEAVAKGYTTWHHAL
ncbi:MAG: 4-(cytidine 5'-diphospho)-2-C-methyl-D-erythritol kinase [Bacteroidota bacterium]|nr:4-(cytidine 5'-diphospho)-2-C-methyl-D-erythritol kinase [Bacteroidota bacterium]MDE2644380.1 4-(cytidine 5'-diphospho)-2-C-methyl-D-erythritol kinase [Bacteroidota bacterium]